MKILVVALEYCDPIFSGNGILARTIITELISKQHQIMVLCASPEINPSRPELDGNITVCCSSVPSSKWKRLDRHSAWEDFAQSSKSSFQEAVITFNPNVAICVDWSGFHCWNSFKHQIPSCTSIFFMFRVFSRSLELHENIQDSQFYVDQETSAIQNSDLTIVLSSADKKFVAAKFKDLFETRQLPIVILPPLRPDLYQSALEMKDIDASSSTRRHICCVCRLSPEKNVKFFADVMSQISTELQALDIIPVICGSTPDQDYAEEVYSTLQTCMPSAIIYRKFLNPQQLTDLFKISLLNFHPALHEAFGMTIVEAAAFGCPSVVHHRDVGAIEVFRDPSKSCICLNYELGASKVAQQLLKYLHSIDTISTLGNMARQDALCTSADKFCDKLLDAIN